MGRTKRVELTRTSSRLPLSVMRVAAAIASFIGYRHSLTSQLAPRRLADAGDDIFQGLVNILADEFSPIVVRSGIPSARQPRQVYQHQIGCGGEIGGPLAGIVGCSVGGDGTAAGADFVHILAPEQKLNCVPLVEMFYSVPSSFMDSMSSAVICGNSPRLLMMPAPESPST